MSVRTGEPVIKEMSAVAIGGKRSTAGATAPVARSCQATDLDASTIHGAAMTQNSNFKSRVRARMQQTGERYTVAASALAELDAQELEEPGRDVQSEEGAPENAARSDNQ